MTNTQLRTIRHVAWVLGRLVLAGIVVVLFLLFVFTIKILWGD